MALFFGAAAQATDRSMKEWKALFDAEDAQQAQQELQERQLQLQQAQLDWQERSQKLTQDYNLGVLDRNERERWGQETLRLLNESEDPSQQWGYYTALRDAGSMYASTAMHSINNGLVNSPREAQQYLSSIISASPGTAFDLEWTRVNANAMAGYLGKEGKDREAYVQGYLDLVTDLNSGKEEIDTLLVDKLRLDNNELASRIELNEANAANINTRTDEIATRLGWDAEKHPVELALLESQSDLINSEATIQALVAGNMPTQLLLQNRQLQAEIQKSENYNELFSATFEDQVRQMAAATGLQEEELRHMLATSSARDAIVTGNLEHLNATIAHLKSQTETEEYQREYLGVQIDNGRLANQEARLGIVNELVTAGQGALLSQVGADLLTGMVAEEDLPGLLTELETIANDRLDNSTKLAQANTRIALAQANFDEQTLSDRVEQTAIATGVAKDQAQMIGWQREHFLENMHREWDLAERGMRVQERQVEAYISSLSMGGANAGTDVANPLAILKDIKDATGFTTLEMNRQLDEVDTLRSTVARLMTATAEDQLAMIPSLSEQYGFTADSGEAAVAALNALISTKESRIVNAIHQILDGGMGYGHLFTEAQLGLPKGHPLFQSAMDRYPFFVEQDQAMDAAVSAIDGRVNQVVLQAAANIPTDTWMLGGNRATYDALVEELGPEALAAVGIEDASDLLPAFDSASQAHRENIEVVNRYADTLGMDVSTRQGRDQAQTTVVGLVDTFDRLEQSIRALGSNPNPQQAQVLFNQFATLMESVLGVNPNFEMMMSPEGTPQVHLALQGINSVRSQLIEVQAAIQFLNTH